MGYGIHKKTKKEARDAITRHCSKKTGIMEGGNQLKQSVTAMSSKSDKQYREIGGKYMVAVAVKAIVRLYTLCLV